MFATLMEVMSARFGMSLQGWALPGANKQGAVKEVTARVIEETFPSQLRGLRGEVERDASYTRKDPIKTTSRIRNLAVGVLLRMGIPWDYAWSHELDSKFIQFLTVQYGSGNRTVLKAGNTTGNKDLEQVNRFVARLRGDPLRATSAEDAIYIRSPLAADLIKKLAATVKHKLLNYAKSSGAVTRQKHYDDLFRRALEYTAAIGCIRVSTLLHFTVSGLLQVNPKKNQFYGPGLNALFHLKTYEEVAGDQASRRQVSGLVCFAVHTQIHMQYTFFNMQMEDLEADNSVPFTSMVDLVASNDSYIVNSICTELVRGGIVFPGFLYVNKLLDFFACEKGPSRGNFKR